MTIHGGINSIAYTQIHVRVKFIFNGVNINFALKVNGKCVKSYTITANALEWELVERYNPKIKLSYGVAEFTESLSQTFMASPLGSVLSR